MFLLMRDVTCPNLARLIGICPDVNNVMILTEHCARGSLQVSIAVTCHYHVKYLVDRQKKSILKCQGKRKPRKT